MNTGKMSAFVRMYHNIEREGIIYREKNTWLKPDEYEEIFQSIKAQTSDVYEFIDGFLSPIILARSAYNEMMLHNELRQGVKHVVMLASGYDQYPYNHDVSRVDIYDLDLKSVLMNKEKRFKSERHHMIPCDLKKDDISQLLSFDEKAYVTLLGISYYMTVDEFKRTLKQIHQMIPVGSSVIFDYSNEEFDPRFMMQIKMAEQLSEPMQLFMDQRTLEEICDECGFLLYDHMNHKMIEDMFYTKYNSQYKKVKPFSNINICCIVKDK